MMATAIAEKLKAQGITKHGTELQIAIAKFQNNGGTYAEALALLDAAYELGGEAVVYVPEGRPILADPPKPNAGAGLHTPANKAVSLAPAPATQRSAGHCGGAKKANGALPVASPRKSPGHAKRGMAEIAAVQDVMARSLFDTIKLPDGRPLRQVRWSEVPRLSSRYVFLARVMTLCHRKGIPMDPASTLDQIVKESELKEIVEATERLNDAGI
jgi:hypothetical protein